MGYVAPEQKREVARAALAEGATFREAAKAAGVVAGTVSKWAKKYGWGVPNAEQRRAQTDAANETRRASFDERRELLAHELLDDVQKLRRQLFAPCTERKVVTLSGGKDNPAEWEIVDVERERPTFGEQKDIMTSLAIGVDKVQVLTGAASSRHEFAWAKAEPAQVAALGDELKARREAKAS